MQQSARAATPHGSAAPNPRDVATGVVPAGVPQRWQKCAPGESGAAQLAQAAPASAVPQLAQKRPSPEAPQEGQVPGVVGAVMPGS